MDIFRLHWKACPVICEVALEACPVICEVVLEESVLGSGAMQSIFESLERELAFPAAVPRIKQDINRLLVAAEMHVFEEHTGELLLRNGERALVSLLPAES